MLLFAHASIPAGSLAVVVGAGHSGTAACRLLRCMGARVRLLDRKPECIDPVFLDWAQAEAVELLGGEHSSEQFAGADVIVLSPGVPVNTIQALVPHARIAQPVQQQVEPDQACSEVKPGPELIAETELAWRLLDGEPVLGVTGTSGKTTTVTLCAAMLAEQGLKVFLGGNIGTPLSQYLLDLAGGAPRADVLVLELSSFQLQACSSLRPRVGVLLGISPNHLDHHADMAEYSDAKFRLFQCQGPDDCAVLPQSLCADAHARGLQARCVALDTHVEDESKFASSFLSPDLYSLDFSDMRLFGPHNRSNAQAAWFACREFGVSAEAARRAAASLAPLAHRLEQVAELNGVLYVNDSKCTTIAALKVALEAFARPILLLAGGKFKGGDLAELRTLVHKQVRAVGLYGAQRELFEQAWQGAADISYDPTLEQALRRLSLSAQPGDVVLLAPATASYDQYPHYMARGEDFKRVVSLIASEHTGAYTA